MPQRNLIWIVEDDEILADIAALRLEQLGHEVLRFQQGRDLPLRGNAVRAPDLVMLDTASPGSDPKALVGRLKSHPTTSAARIVVYSTSGSADLERCRATGAHAVLESPFDLARLDSSVSQFNAHSA